MERLLSLTNKPTIQLFISNACHAKPLRDDEDGNNFCHHNNAFLQ
jgi:hypothetical protein